jgi:ParB family chromosome partitioning protein
MQESIELDRLSLTNYRQHGLKPNDSPALRRRIQGHGCIDPVIVRPCPDQPNRYEIISNAETYIAAGKLGLTKVPVVVRDDLDDGEAEDILREQQLAAAGNPIDEAESLEQQLDEQSLVHGGKPSIARLARLTGKSRSQVSRALALLALPPEVQDHFRAGRLSAAHGRLLVKLKNPAEQKRLASKAVREGLSVRALGDLVTGANDTEVAPAASAPEKDPDTLRLERDLTALVGSPISIDHANGTLTIQYFGNFETLEGILLRLGYRQA